MTKATYSIERAVHKRLLERQSGMIYTHDPLSIESIEHANHLI